MSDGPVTDPPEPSNDPDTMSDEEIRLRIALLARARGAPVATIASTVTRVPKRKKAAAFDPKWFQILKTCPHCGKEKNVGKDFGVVIRRGVEGAASWCKQCRSESSASYYKSPRKNVSKHNPAPIAAASQKAPKGKRKK